MSKNTNLSFLTDYITADITNGRIGINNASPTVAFDVVGATKITGVLTLTSTISNGTYTYTLPSATGTLALTSALSSYLPLTGGTLTGALGGTSATFSSSVQADFLVVGSTAASSGGLRLGTQVAIRARNVANTANIPLIESTASDGVSVSNGALILASTGTATFSGNVGVGANPNQSGIGSSNRVLTVKAASSGGEALLELIGLGNNATDNIAKISFMNQAATTALASIEAIRGSSDTVGELSIKTSNTTRLTITSAGNVGIGTSSPNTKLQITGIPATNSDAVYSLILNDSTGYASRLGSGISFGGYYNGTDVSDTFANIKGFKENLTSGDYAGAMSFQTRINGGNPTERMRITSGGSLLMAKDAAIGINTADGSDNGYLALCGASGDGPNRGGHIYLSGNERVSDPGSVVISAGNVIGTGSFIFFRTAGTEKMRIIGSGNVLIGSTSDNGYKLQVTGSIYATGSIVANSDLTLKKNLAIINNPIDKLMQLNGYSYQWKSNDENQYGVIAQEVEKILPYAVSTGDDGIKGVSYNQIIPVLIEAIKELSTEINLLKQK
jgi:hypothetical protein